MTTQQSDSPVDFSDDDHTDVRAELASVQAALVLERARADQLHSALRSNRRIGVATGVIMLMQDIEIDEAFEVLRQASMNRNLKLATLAEDVISWRRLPEHDGTT